MRVVLKAFIVMCLLVFGVSSSTYAMNTDGENSENELSIQITDKKEIKKYEKYISSTKKEVSKKHKKENIEFYQQEVYLFPETNMTAVIYKLKSKKVSLDENVGYMSFIVDNSDPSKVTYQFLRVLNLNKDRKHVLFSQDGIDRIDYIVNATTSELESGWIITNENKKLDVRSSEFEEYTNHANNGYFSNGCSNDNQITTLGVKSFSSCLDKCLSKSNVPKWLRNTIINVASVSCVFGPNPVCLAAITQVAALYTSDAIRCVGACAKK